MLSTSNNNNGCLLSYSPIQTYRPKASVHAAAKSQPSHFPCAISLFLHMLIVILITNCYTPTEIHGREATLSASLSHIHVTKKSVVQGRTYMTATTRSEVRNTDRYNNKCKAWLSDSTICRQRNNAIEEIPKITVWFVN